MNPVADVVSTLGECPMWSVAEGCLYWIDIEGRDVHRLDSSSGAVETVHLPGRPGSLAATETPGILLVAMEHELVWLDWKAGTTEPWIPVEDPRPRVRLNDGRTDPAGRFWVGSFDTDTSAGNHVGMLHRVGGDGSIATVRREIGVSNGLAFSPDGRTMYFADSPKNSVWAFDYDVDSGTATNERLFVDFTDLPGRPDGAAVDSLGCYWVAAVFGWAVIRVTPTGKIDRIVEVPVHKPTMPAFGGNSLDELFITSMSARLGPVPEPQEHAGKVLRLDVGVAGIPEPTFKRSPGG